MKYNWKDKTLLNTKIKDLRWRKHKVWITQHKEE